MRRRYWRWVYLLAALSILVAGCTAQELGTSVEQPVPQTQDAATEPDQPEDESTALPP